MPLKEFETNEDRLSVFVDTVEVCMLLSIPDSLDECIIVMKNGREVAVIGSPLLISVEIQHA